MPSRSRSIAGTTVIPWLRSSFLTPASNLWALATALGLRDLLRPGEGTMTPSASYRTPVEPWNVGLWSYHLCPTSSPTFRSTAERRSPAISFLRASAAAALRGPT